MLNSGCMLKLISLPERQYLVSGSPVQHFTKAVLHRYLEYRQRTQHLSGKQANTQRILRSNHGLKCLNRSHWNGKPNLSLCCSTDQSMTRFWHPLQFKQREKFSIEMKFSQIETGFQQGRLTEGRQQFCLFKGCRDAKES